MSEWGWQARIFFSVDIVGSTSFKNSNRESKEKAPDWPPPFRHFFGQFPKTLNDAYEQIKGGVVSEIDPRGERLSPWKFVGDEILFESNLTKHQEVLWHILAVRHSLLDYVKKEFESKSYPLNLKATAWFAGFPVTNMRATIPLENSGLSLVDYIGPQMDLGFRLAGLSNSRRMPLSVDLALMALDVLTTLPMQTDALCPIHFEGYENFKGVPDEFYPSVWVDTNEGKQTIEEKLLQRSKRNYNTDYGKELRDFLRNYLEKSPGQRIPFILNDNLYGNIPQELETIRQNMESQDSDRGLAEDMPDQLGDPEMPDNPTINS